MAIVRTHIQLAALLVFSVCSNAAVAEETDKNDNKNIRASDAISNADITNHAYGRFKPAVDKRTDTSINPYRKPEGETESFKQAKDDWRQRQRQQQAHQRYLQNRDRYMDANPAVPADLRLQHNEYIRQMEQRRQLFNKMNEQHRQDAEQRREQMRQKMHQTRNPSPVIADS